MSQFTKEFTTDERARVGMFTGGVPSAGWKTSKIPCPYCHDSLSSTDWPVKRIAQLQEFKNGKAIGTLEEVPSTHLVLNCKNCKQTFTTLKS